jgi:hypothetical protein
LNIKAEEINVKSETVGEYKRLPFSIDSVMQFLSKPSSVFFIDIYKIILKFIWKSKRTRINDFEKTKVIRWEESA